MTDEATLAQQAVEYLVSCLGDAGRRATTKLADQAPAGAVRLFAFVKSKFVSKSQTEAVEDFAASPDDADTQAVLRQQLKKALASDQAFAAELRSLFASLPPAPIQQSATVAGDNNTTVQAGRDAQVGRR